MTDYNIVSITIDDVEYVFNILDRHLLYCAQDEREISSKYHGVEVALATLELYEYGFLQLDFTLTVKGEEATSLLRIESEKRKQQIDNS